MARSPGPISAACAICVLKRNSDRVAGAGGAPYAAMQRGNEFRTRRMILHLGRIRACVGEHPAVVLDDGGASIRGTGDIIRNGLHAAAVAILFYGLSKEPRVLFERGPRLVEERLLPGFADGEIERESRDSNNQHKGAEQLKEDTTSHLGTSKR